MVFSTPQRFATLGLILLTAFAGIFAPNLATAQRMRRDQSLSRQESQSSAVVRDASKSNTDADPRAPLSRAVFIENRGQFDSRVRYQVRMGGQVAWLTASGIVFDAIRPTRGEGPLYSAVPRRESLNPFLPLATSDHSTSQSRFDRLVFAEDFVSASCCSNVEGKGLQSGIYNYLGVEGRMQSHTNVHGYSEVVYHNVWPGVNLRIYGKGLDLEQEFILQPGADLTNVRVAYMGMENMTISPDGSLEVHTAFGTLRETKPLLYQDIAGKRIAVDGRFKLTSSNTYTFDIGAHKPEFALVVDPTLLYSTFLGGSAGNNVYTSNQEVATGIAVDASGNAYVAGYTASTDFPTTVGAFQVTPPSGSFITKLNSTGSARMYSTYLGSSSRITAIAVDAAGDAYVTGIAFAGLPVTPNAYWPRTSQTCGSDFFLTKLNTTGSALVYSTCLNDSGDFGGVSYGNYPHAIAVDSKGRAFVAGSVSQGFIPTTPNAYQQSGCNCASSGFVMVFDTNLSGASSLVYSTYFGVTTPASNYYGSSVNGIAVDFYGHIYITGWAGPNLPISAGAFQSTTGGGLCNPAGGLQLPCPDAFVAKLDPSTSGAQGLLYSTYLGGVGFDSGNAIAVDGAGNAYVTGNAGSAGFPVTSGAFQTNASASPLFVTKVNAVGSKLVYSTYLSGNASANNNSANGIAIDSAGNAYIAGGFRAQSLSTFPVTPDAFQSSFSKLSGDYSEAFLTKLNSGGSGLIYSTYLGGNGDDVATGLTIDQTGDVYIAGHTSSGNFPVSSQAFQPSMRGTGDTFVTKFPFSSNQALSVTAIAPQTGGNAGPVTPQIVGTGFHAGVTAKLNCGGRSIAGANLNVAAGGRYLSATFELTTVSPGKCDVVITNSDGTSATLAQAFAVQPGGVPNIKVAATGAAVRQGPSEVPDAPTNSVYFVTVHNTANVDSPEGLLSVSLSSPFVSTSADPADLASQTSSIKLWTTNPLPAGSARSFTVTGTTSADLANVKNVDSSKIVGFGSVYDSTTAAITGPITLPTCDVVNTKITECWYPNSDFSPGTFIACLNEPSLWDQFKIGITCAQVIPTCASAGTGWAGIAKCVLGAASCAVTAGPLVTHCLDVASVPGTPVCSYHMIPCYQPSDPNSLNGPPGIGSQRWVSSTQPLTYLITFENKPEATAPAQKVIVTQQLPGTLDLTTLELLTLTVPNGTSTIPVNIPAGSFYPLNGLNQFVTNVDLRPRRNMLVNIDAKLDTTARTLVWTFTTIDPTTGQPPLNPLIGFLPANSSGSVGYRIVPTKEVTTGTQITGQATILFIGDSPTNTPAWTNAIDSASPVSRVATLSSTSPCSSFRVSWSGSDIGAGLGSFSVYVSDNGAPFAPWLANTTAVSAVYTGSVGHTYSFYSISSDLVGNLEPAKSAAEASTRVTETGLCGPPSLAGQISGLSRSGTAITATLTLTNTGLTAAQAVNINQISFRTLSGSGTVTLVTPSLPTGKGPLAIAASTAVPLALNVPATVTRFSITESGTLQDGSGNNYSYSVAQTVIP